MNWICLTKSLDFVSQNQLKRKEAGCDQTFLKPLKEEDKQGQSGDASTVGTSILITQRNGAL